MPKTKLQICMAICILGLIAVIALFQKLDAIASGCTTGIAALGMKLLEHTPNTP